MDPKVEMHLRWLNLLYYPLVDLTKIRDLGLDRVRVGQKQSSVPDDDSSFC